ncbi:MAG: flagellar hook-associated protein 3 [Nitrospirae bacterium]|nr:MAG: flagellar hook-associated protein 3 [Nitrospirota bacterium]
MRVSSFLIYDRVTKAIQQDLEELYYLYEQASTGKKINRPSEGVIETSRAMVYKLSIRAKEQFKKNITDTKVFLEATDTVLAHVSDSLIRTKELALQAVNGTLSNEDRISISKEIEEIRGHLLSLSNTTVRGKYIFSGMKTDTPAYDTTTGTYQGDQNYILVPTSSDGTVKKNLLGPDAFSYVQGSHEVVDFGGGLYLHYIPGQNIDPAAPQERVVVVFSTSADPSTVEAELQAGPPYTTVQDIFQYDNVFQALEIMKTALEQNNYNRLQAMLKSIDDFIDQTASGRAEVGARLNYLDAEIERIEDNTLSLKEALSETEDADLAEVISNISKTEAALQALRQAGERLLSNSLFDFIK